MLTWSLTFLAVGLIAGLIGLSGLSGTVTQIAWNMFVVFLILYLVSLVARRRVTYYFGRGKERPHLLIVSPQRVAHLKSRSDTKVNLKSLVAAGRQKRKTDIDTHRPHRGRITESVTGGKFDIGQRQVECPARHLPEIDE